MQKDLKIGLAVGLGLAAAAVVWVATRPSMSPEARIRQLHETVPQAEPNEQSVVSIIARSPEPNVQAPQPAPPETPPAEPAGGNVAPAVEEPAVAKEQKSLQEGSLDSTVHEQIEKIEPQRFYIVRKGDTLSKISQTYYGSPGKWQKIYDANKETIKNPDRLSPGQKLLIPD
jgi:nucleoid-associated protein YgaU